MGNVASQVSINQSLGHDKTPTLEITVFSATSKQNNANCTVIEYKPTKSSPDSMDWVKNAVLRLKLLRHPGIIKFTSVEEGSDAVRVVTEPVYPLKLVLSRLNEEQVILGIRNITETLEFLHSEKLCHNNLKLDSVYVSAEDGRWLIGGMELVTRFDDLSPIMRSKLRTFLPPDIVPPEDMDPTIQGEPASRDSYALGFLLSDIISRFLVATKPILPSPVSATPGVSSSTSLPGHEDDNPTDHADSQTNYDWTCLQDIADKMVSRQPVKRPRPQEILKSPFFTHNAFANAVAALGGIRTFDSNKKRQIFAELPKKLVLVSQQTIVNYILPLLLNPEFFSEPGSTATFSAIFSCQGDNHLISPTDYQNFIIPFLKDMWTIRRLDVRRGLLDTFEKYIDALIDSDAPFVEGTLLNEILIGLEEIDIDVYVNSINALCLIIPKIVLSALPSSKRTAIIDPLRPSAEILRPSPSEYVNTIIPTSSPKAESISKTDSSSQSNSSSSQQKEERSVHSIVDGFVIPHVLSVVCMDGTDGKFWWLIVEGAVMLWKRLCVLEGRYKMSQLRIPTRSLLRLMSLILKASSPPRKIMFITKLIIADVSAIPNPPASYAFLHWAPRSMELLSPLLRDESSEMRNMVSTAIQSISSTVASSMETAPAVLKRRDESISTAERLRRVTQAHSTARRIRLPRTGPRMHHHEGAGPVKIDIDRSSLEVEEDWVYDVRASPADGVFVNRRDGKQKSTIVEKSNKDVVPRPSASALNAVGVSNTVDSGVSKVDINHSVSATNDVKDSSSNSIKGGGIEDSNKKVTKVPYSIDSKSSKVNMQSPPQESGRDETKSGESQPQPPLQLQEHTNDSSKVESSPRSKKSSSADNAVAPSLSTTPHKPSPLRNSAVFISDEELNILSRSVLDHSKVMTGMKDDGDSTAAPPIVEKSNNIAYGVESASAMGGNHDGVVDSSALSSAAVMEIVEEGGGIT
ncbi:hypothetical protein SeMB42_g04803 [Synchytrium endobioticum]|uniref:Protein kinase domain-containing protein n=1 Tax=Synchytrium endobioticum TaxID=286115 RepID=A0A507DC17_9FUNG|nr:hypothetical protein SeMB42_g04803 [Synchytrium endobioticum]TPX49133.1 hypothetical protein SeLEV6574_g01641 [Synchytrium endobioticum]